MTLERRFKFRLALALGFPNPESMLARMPHRIYREWQTYYAHEPFGEERADVRSAIIAQTFANVHRKRGTRPLSYTEFMPHFGPPPEPKTPDDLLAKIIGINAAMGGSFVDKRPKQGG